MVVKEIRDRGANGAYEDEIVAIMDVNFGVRRYTVKEYLQSLKHYGSIVTDGVKWYTPENFPKRNLGDFIVDGLVTKLRTDPDKQAS